MIGNITWRQVRGGRRLAGLDVRELAELSGRSAVTIANLESGLTRTPQQATLDSTRQALEGQGIEFASGGWVRHLGDRVSGPSKRVAMGTRDRVVRMLQPLLTSPCPACKATSDTTLQAVLEELQSC